jgi:hypothetical protein
MLRKHFRLTALVGVIVAVTAAGAFAAPGGQSKSSSSSIALVLTSVGTTSGTNASPSYGDAVTFSVSTDATSQPFVHLVCSQNGSTVLESWQAWFYGAVGTQTFNLGPSPAWQSGAADCTAYLENWDSYSKNGKTSVLASTSFHVNA